MAEEILENLEENEEETEEVLEKTEVEILQDEINAKNDSFLRLSAEYDNFRKRSAKEKSESYSNGVSKAVNELLPVYDTLSMALQGEMKEEDPHLKGLELTFKQLCEALKKLGVEEIDSERGTKFDANLHNAVMHLEDDTLGENEIANTFQKGFKIGDKVIRYSTVQVAN